MEEAITTKLSAICGCGWVAHSDPTGGVQTSIAAVLTTAIEHAETKHHTVLFQGEVRVDKGKFTKGVKP